MLKYMLTTRCNRNCDYCITRKVKCEEVTDLIAVERKLRELRQEHEEIMLSGGEPTISKMFYEKEIMARKIFNKVFITSQNPNILKEKNRFSAITFSLHDLRIYPIENNATVYGSILDQQYSKDLPEKMKLAGYKGLTINEEQRGTKTFTEELPNISDFSIKINRRGKCIHDTILLPNLRVIEDFTPYL
jgi:hypothetical protein